MELLGAGFERAKRRVGVGLFLLGAAAVAAFGFDRATEVTDFGGVGVARQTDALHAAARAWFWEGYGPACPSVARLEADGFLDPRQPAVDPWGTPFDIACDGRRVRVRSAGPDRRLDTADDIGAPSQ